VAKSPDEFKPADADEALADPQLAVEPTGDESGQLVDSDTQQQVQQLQDELKQAQDRLLRSQAELENFRRRTQREMQDERRFATQPLLVDLLPVLDNMERAIDAAEQNPEGTGLLQGFKMLHQLLITTLEKHNCRQVPAIGMNFDPTLHQALAQMPSADYAPGKIAIVNQPGYQLHDRVIRPAQVVVSTGPPTEE
jgi:molecular chaperone GrpE